MSAGKAKTDVITPIVERTETRKAFWMQEASIEEILMALFHEADAVTFRYELVTQPDGSEQARYRVEASLLGETSGILYDFGALSTDEHSQDIVTPFGEVLCAVLAARGPRSMWSDWWMEKHRRPEEGEAV